ncbi:MAG: hypothetical protein SFU83_13195 [Meiothermus sp.]|nr:hypothetical protein [Meiothermus sp.]
MNMPKLTLNIGVAMVALGLVAYLASGMASATALIPAFLGAVLAGLGWVAQTNEGLRRHAIHGALLIALVAVLGSLRVFGMLGGGLSIAVVSQLLMLVLGLALLIPGVQSFVQARRKAR